MHFSVASPEFYMLNRFVTEKLDAKKKSFGKN